MASLRNHKVVEVWKSKISNTRYHVTENDRVLMTTGPMGGGAKILMMSNDDTSFSIGLYFTKRATATAWKANSNSFKNCERER